MTHIIERARLFATAAHAAVGQVRKYSGEAYIHHPKRVAAMVQNLGHLSANAVAAAWLHDVLEDTKVHKLTMAEEFGLDVTGMVLELTNVEKSAGNRRERFQMNLERLRNCSPEAATIKLADIIDNTGSIVKHDPRFAEVYLAEKEQVLMALRHGSLPLWQQAHEIVEEGLTQFRRLGAAA